MVLVQQGEDYMVDDDDAEDYMKEKGFNVDLNESKF